MTNPSHSLDIVIAAVREHLTDISVLMAEAERVQGKLGNATEATTDKSHKPAQVCDLLELRDHFKRLAKRVTDLETAEKLQSNIIDAIREQLNDLDNDGLGFAELAQRITALESRPAPVPAPVVRTDTAAPASNVPQLSHVRRNRHEHTFHCNHCGQIQIILLKD